MNAISKNIRLLRQQSNWTQGDLAKKLGITIAALSKIETGETDLNFSRLKQIAARFGMSPQELLNTDAAKNKNRLNIARLKNKLAQKGRKIIKLQKEIIRFYEAERSSCK